MVGIIRAYVPDIGGQADFLQHANRQVADIGLPPVPSETRDSGPRMMVPMPVLALAELHQGKPSHVAAGILAGRNPGFRMAHAIDEALRMKGEDQPNRPHPEKSASAEIQAPEK